MSTAVKERPILFSGPMVRAILDGRKTQTRRIVKNINPTLLDSKPESHHILNTIRCPFGDAGDRLWVRESHAIYTDAIRCKKGDEVILFRADAAAYWNMTPYALMEAEFNPLRDTADYEPKWRPSIHMPRWASRITLEITGVRCERLNDISAGDAIAEGIESESHRVLGRHYKLYGDLEKHNQWTVGPKWSYETLWEVINGPGSWAANPWVWVIAFKKELGA